MRSNRRRKEGQRDPLKQFCEELLGNVYLAVNEVQSADAVSRERRVRTSAHLACDVLGNILSQQTFNVLQEVNRASRSTLVRAHLDLETVAPSEVLTFGTNFPRITRRWLPSMDPSVP